MCGNCKTKSGSSRFEEEVSMISAPVDLVIFVVTGQDFGRNDRTMIVLMKNPAIISLLMSSCEHLWADRSTRAHESANSRAQ